MGSCNVTSDKSGIASTRSTSACMSGVDAASQRLVEDLRDMMSDR